MPLRLNAQPSNLGQCPQPVRVCRKPGRRCAECVFRFDLNRVISRLRMPREKVCCWAVVGPKCYMKTASLEVFILQVRHVFPRCKHIA